MEDFDQQCPACEGSGRVTSGHENVDTLQHQVATVKYQIAQLTEDFGLDLHHRVSLPGEADARRQVGELQAQLAKTLDALHAARSAAGGEERMCPRCRGRGFILTSAGEKLFSFVCRWIHPQP